jgi:hypothetical protein
MLKFSGLILPSILMLNSIGCNSLPGLKNDLSNENQPRVQDETAKQANVGQPLDPDAPTWQKTAWSTFIADGQYRLAHPLDFEIPQVVFADEIRRQSALRSIKYPYMRGDFDRDNSHDDLAVIVIDTRKEENDPARFRVVIFNTPAKDKQSSPKWVRSNVDSTRTVLQKWSGGIGLLTYKENNATEFCYVTWSKNQYKCE